MKLYKSRTGMIGDYSKDSEALITRDKLVMSYSTYRGGTTAYMNYIVINLGFWKPHFAWPSEDVTGYYPL